MGLFKHKLKFSLRYISKYSVTKKNERTFHSTRTRTQNLEYTEQFKLHFTDIHRRVKWNTKK